MSKRLSPRLVILCRQWKKKQAAAAAAASAGPSKDKGRQQQQKQQQQQQQGEAGRWALLPAPVLRDVLVLLPAADLVSAGQTCSAWRQAALEPGVWRRQSVVYDPLDGTAGFHDWHFNARNFARIVRFAPCLGEVRCNRGMQPDARTAISESDAEVSLHALGLCVKLLDTYLCKNLCMQNLGNVHKPTGTNEKHAVQTDALRNTQFKLTL